MTAIRRKKLYFDVSLVGAVKAQVFPCTQFRISYTGDNFGAVLDDLPPLTNTSPSESKRRNSVCAWFQPTDGQSLPDLAAGTAPVLARNSHVFVRFVNATTSTSPTFPTDLTFPGLLPGSSPIGTRHFSVLVARPGGDFLDNNGTSPTVRGVLYVQRQHSIEI